MLVHDRPERHGRGGRRSWPGKRSRPQYGLWRGWDIAEGRVRPDRIVVPAPCLDDDLGLLERVEDLAVEQLVPEFRVKALDVAVLPWAAWGDIDGLCAYSRDPALDCLAGELGPIVGPYVAGHAAQDEEVGQHVDHVGPLELSCDPDRQAFAGELVEDIEHPDLPAVMGPGLDKVVGPDVVGVLRPQADAGTVVEPEPPFLRLLGRHLQPLPSPDPLHPLEVHHPAGSPQHGGDPPIAVAAVLDGKGDNVGREPLLVVRGRRDLALRRAVLSEHTAGHALGHAMFGHHMLDAGAAAGGAQKFPAAASFRINFSSVRSETARRRRAFSASSSFRRFTWSPFKPPYS